MPRSPTLAPGAPRGRLLTPLVLTLFLVSGASGLVLEVVWSRMLSTLLGATTWGLLTTLVVYMGGLGFGGLLWGGRAGRSRSPLRLYGWLEVGVGLYTLAVPWLFVAIGSVYTTTARLLGESYGWGQVARVSAAVLALLVPTLLMGGTLPVLARVLATTSRGEPGRGAGLLYAVNTLGAVAGCFLAGFVLLPAVGVSATNALAAVADLLVGILALFAGGRGATAIGPVPEPEAARPAPVAALDPAARLVLLIAAGSGFCGLAYEMLWTRALLAALTESTIYAFTLMLGVFLAGHAAGSGLACRPGTAAGGAAGDRRRLGWLQAMAGLSASCSLPILIAAQELLDQYILVGPRSTFWGLIVPFHLGVCVLVVFVPAMFLGATFPVAARLFIGARGDAAARTGRLYASNTAGAILGAVVAAVVLVPRLGTQRTLWALATVQGVWGILLFLAGEGRRGLAPRLVAAMGLAALLAVATAGNRSLTLATVYARKEPGTMLALVEGDGATVSVHHRRNGDRVININSVNVAGTNRVLRTTQKLQAHLPMLLRPDARAALQVGFGAGGTCHSLSLHRGLETIDVAELSAEVPAVASVYFREINRGVLDDPRVRLHTVDARSYMAVAARTYDLILSDSIHPRFRGNSTLYSRDYFALCARRLRPGGLVSTWLPLYGMSTAEIRTILASMRSVFPHMQVWYPNAESNENTIVIGSRSTIAIDWRRLVATLAEPAVASDLAEVGIVGPEPLLDFFLVGDRGIAALAAGARLNTDDRPILEFLAPRTLHRSPAWKANFQALVAHREPIGAALVGAGPDVRARLDRWYAATGAKLEAQAFEIDGHFADAARGYAACVRANPDDREAGLRLAAYRRLLSDPARTP